MEIPTYQSVIVAPGFENNQHRSELHWDTRLRLRAAAELYRHGEIEHIIVDGAQLREMTQPFAVLMKDWLIKPLGVSPSVIEMEEDTFDTASQIKWIKNNQQILENGRVAFITDNEQARHVRALMQGFGVNGVDVLTTKDIFLRYSVHDARLLDHVEHSYYWLEWKMREFLLSSFTKTFDHRGWLLSKITSRRVH